MAEIGFGKLNPRKYQLDIYRSIVKRGNTLVVLPTGLGKTMIALLVMRDFLARGEKILFLAPTKPLVEQHAKTIKENLGVDEGRIAVITGEIKRDERVALWGKEVIVATPQTVRNDLERGVAIKPALIIFDEAHRVVGNYAYTYIASAFKDALMVGLTASPGSDRKKIEGIMKALGIKNVEIRGREDEDVREYVKELKIRWVSVELPQEFREVKHIIESIVDEKIGKLREAGFTRIHGHAGISKKRLIEIGERIRRDGRKPTVFYAAQLYSSLMALMHALELLETQGRSTFLEFFDRLERRDKKSRGIKSVLNDWRIKQIRERMKGINMEHPKLTELKKLVEERKNQSIIVFVHYRDQVRKVVEELSGIVKVRRFVGKAEITQKEQARIIEEFRRGEFNILVASSIGEEGLDIPSVDCVIFYEPVPSAIRSIQRRGRAGRSKSGEVIVLVTRNTRDEAYYWVAKAKEKKMERIIQGIASGKDAGKKVVIGQTKISDFL
ncbi:MAG: helicase-related protein [Candidatus Micrarchaeia archaeon]